MTQGPIEQRLPLHTVLLVTGLSVFVLYYTLHIFRYTWIGDIHPYLAAIHALYRSVWPAENSVMPVDSRHSMYTPYLVFIAVVGKALGVSPYRALQLAGATNLVLYATAIVLFFRTFSVFSKSAWPPLIFLVVSLFLRAEHHSWSSETNYLTLRVIQAYPSLLAWTLALISFVLAELMLRRGHSRWALGGLLALLIAFQFLNHALTASWVIGIIGLRALYLIATTSWPRNNTREKATAAVGASEGFASAVSLFATLVLGVGITFLWPYSSPFALAGYLTIPENIAEDATYGGNPIRLMPAAYALGVLAAIPFVGGGMHRFWLIAFVATFCAWAAYRLIGIHFGDRYVYFMAFFPQLFIAEGTAYALHRLFGRSEQQTVFRIALTAYLVLLILAIMHAPILKWEYRKTVRSPWELWNAASTERAYYDHWEPLRAALGRADLIMMPQVHEAYDIAAVTGAKVVAVPFAFTVPDFAERTISIARFFTKGTNASARMSELARWGANKVVLVGEALAVAPEMETLFGEPLWRDATCMVFAAGQPNQRD
jgi:hypothetical protein